MDRELALLNERICRLEELYRRGEVEETYKKLKEEHENRKREFEKKVEKQGLEGEQDRLLMRRKETQPPA